MSCLFSPGTGWDEHPPTAQPLTAARAVGTSLPAYPVRVNPAFCAENVPGGPPNPAPTK